MAGWLACARRWSWSWRTDVAGSVLALSQRIVEEKVASKADEQHADIEKLNARLTRRKAKSLNEQHDVLVKDHTEDMDDLELDL